MKARVGDQLVGKRLAGYRIEEALGRGAMGSVYRATQLTLNRPVALKILSPELTGDRDFVRQFLEEARAIARLNHPSMVQVYDAGQAGKLFYFAMEYLPGGTLANRLDSDGALRPAVALGMARSAAQALVWAEQKGIIHRDIKPSNLLLDDGGAVKVADFGIAIDSYVARSGDRKKWVGSPRYMAPEQIQGEPLDHRVDIYSLGCTLFRALTGKHAFGGKTVEEVFTAKLNADSPRIEAELPDIPVVVARVVNRMVMRDPENRYPSCEAMLGALEQALEALREGSPGSDAMPSPGHRESPRRRRRAAAIGAVALLAIAIPLTWGIVTFLPAPEEAEKPAAGSIKPPPPATASAATADRADQKARPPQDPGPKATVPSPSHTIPDTTRERVTKDVGVSVAPPESLQEAREIAAGRRKEFNRALENDVEPLFGAGRFADALARIEAIGDSYPEHAESLAPVAESIATAARLFWTATVKESGPLVRTGKFDEARKHVRDSVALLPSTFAVESEAVLASISTQQDIHEQCGRDLADLQKRLAIAIGALDFDGARSVVSGLPEHPAGSAAAALVARRRPRLAEQIELAGTAWEKLSAGIDRAIHDKLEIKEPFQDPLDHSDDTYRIRSRDGAVVTVQNLGRGKPTPLDIFSLSTWQLLDFVREGEAKAAVPPPHREGLGVLLLYRDRPFDARKLILDSRPESPLAVFHQSRIETRVSQALARSRKDLVGRLDKLDATPETSLDTMNALARDTAKFIRTACKSPGYDAVRDELLSVFTRARTKTLIDNLPGELFNSTLKSYKPEGRLVKLVYRFSSQEELDDFVPVPPTTTPPVFNGKTLTLNGEFRFCQGDPFVDRLEVTAEVPAGMYNLRAPNINVALWTREEDRISPVEPDPDAPATETPPPDAGAGKTLGDFFVFGLGFKRTGVAVGTTIPVHGLDTVVPMPALVLIAGTRGKTLHTFPTQECMWGTGVTGTLRGKQVFRVSMNTREVRWSVNGRRIPIGRSKDLGRFRRSASYGGSFTFFTAGETVQFYSLLVEGRLDQDWIDDQFKQQVKSEVEALEK